MCCGMNLVQAAKYAKAFYGVEKTVISADLEIINLSAESEDPDYIVEVADTFYVGSVSVVFRAEEDSAIIDNLEMLLKGYAKDMRYKMEVLEMGTPDGLVRKSFPFFIPMVAFKELMIACDSGQVFVDAQFIGNKIITEP